MQATRTREKDCLLQASSSCTGDNELGLYNVVKMTLNCIGATMFGLQNETSCKGCTLMGQINSGKCVFLHTSMKEMRFCQFCL